MTARRRKILVVDDDPAIRETFDMLLGDWGFDVIQAGHAGEALQLVDRYDPDIVISDVVMPEMSGLELLRQLKVGDPNRPVILVTAQGSIDMAVESIKQGALDFLTKPVTDDARLKALLEEAEKEIEMRRKSKRLAARVEKEGGLGEFIGVSKPMRDIFEMIENVAARDVSVMITGESGTGKELVARSIHNLSLRQNKPFLAINAAAIPETLIESEVFGHERGAFTGAVSMHAGCFEQAHGGTLFLDEIAEMPVSLQPKLLRVLADSRVRRLGATQEIEFDVRVVAATNQDPLQSIEEGKLRRDLYYRLNVVPIMLPPLRDRQEDIPLIAQHFLNEFNRKHHASLEGISDDGAALLKTYPWPGNVRELRNVIERAVVLGKDKWIGESSLPPYIRSSSPLGRKLIFAVGATTVAEAERELIVRTLQQAGNNKAEAARQLGVDVKTIYNKLKAYNIEP